MDFNPDDMTASYIADAIRNRRTTATDVLEYFLQRSSVHNSRVNAIVTFDEARARQRAREADEAAARGESWGALHGVPVSFKDCFETAGVRTACGADFLVENVPTRDATVVSRCLEAGAILLGKTNVPTMLDGLDTDNAVFGPTRNPWDLERSAGGSSGGSGAAIAAGLSPLDIASDMGGSIRIPAHLCGTFGLKPTQGRISRAGHVPPLGEVSLYLDNILGTTGPMARSVDDLVLAFNVLAGAVDPRHPETVPMPVAAPDARGAPGHLRLGWIDEFGDLATSRETREVLEAFVANIGADGLTVGKIAPAHFDLEKAWKAVGTIFGFIVSAGMNGQVRAGWAKETPLLAGDRSSVFAKGFLSGADLNVDAFMGAMADRLQLVQALDAFLSDDGEVDAWLCPAGVATAPLVGGGTTVEVDGRPTPSTLGLLGYAAIFNLTGNPVISLPVGRSASTGMPIGLQLVGKRWRERELLALAKRLCPDNAPLADITAA